MHYWLCFGVEYVSKVSVCMYVCVYVYMLETFNSFKQLQISQSIKSKQKSNNLETNRKMQDNRIICPVFLYIFRFTQ